ncbi:MAG TPA: hypothetical protein VLM89_07505 [Phycisphaerae bacterium]|nr:hypothetical protein [Phycisphaerae bacterium]
MSISETQTASKKTPDPFGASLFVVTEQPHSMVLEFALVDDPAMPEGFRESCLIRVKNLPPPPGGW